MSHVEIEQNRVAVGSDYCSALYVCRRRTSLLIALLRDLGRDYGLDLRGVERIEDRITLLALGRSLARPLRVLLSPWPRAVGGHRRELELLLLGAEHAGHAVRRMPGGAAAHRLIDHVDNVALFDEIVGPALASVRRTHPVGRRLRGTMDQHQRIGSAHVLRC